MGKEKGLVCTVFEIFDMMAVRKVVPPLDVARSNDVDAYA